MSRVFKSSIHYDLKRLREDVESARRFQEFSEGPYGAAISLPTAEDLGEKYRAHGNNLPFGGALSSCPYLREIFDSFVTEKASFRLLRRGPKGAYSLHDDKDKCAEVVRFQIPITTNDRSYLVLPRADADLSRFDRYASAGGDVTEALWFDLDELYEAFDGKVDLYRLEAGRLYYFDTNEVHSLINAGDQERVTLGIDLVRNDWLRNWMETEVHQAVRPVADFRTSSVRWNWNALRHGVIRTA